MTKRNFTTTMLASCGFTLLELMLVIGIIAGLVALIVPKMNIFQKYQKLDDTAQQLQSHIRLAQNQASSGVKCLSGARAAKWSLVLLNTTSYKIVPECLDGTVKPTTTYSLPLGTIIKSLDTVTVLGTCNVPTNFNGYSLTFDNITAETNFGIPPTSPCVPDSPIKSLSLSLTLPALPSEYTSVVVQKGGGVYIGN